ncbi:MAG: sugar phosphate isomerase/epimerase [Planctomycetes bacterium]|nr:sugar phosphate isomerase/epimerase [Planctomycetota bacterium]
MKFAICNETFQDWPHERAFHFAREVGYTGLEIAPFTINTDVRQITAAQRREIRELADQADLEIIGLHWLLAKTEGFYLTTPDAAVRTATSAYLGELARCCRDLGGSIMVLGSPLQRILLPGVSNDDAMRYAADVLERCMPVCEENDVTIALEPLSPEWGPFLNTAAAGVELMEMVGSPHCRLHLDCIAMCTEPTPIPELLHRHRRELAHFHANDPNKQGPGMGNLDFVPILRALGEIDYQGWVSVEVFDYAPGSERLARESIENLEAALAEVMNAE